MAYRTHKDLDPKSKDKSEYKTPVANAGKPGVEVQKIVTDKGVVIEQKIETH